MFNLSGSELIFLVLIALVVLGPDKLPEAMRKAGKAYADFKKMTNGFQSEMKSVLDEPMRELRETAELAKKSAMFDINDSGNSGSNGDKDASTPTVNRMKPAASKSAGMTPAAEAKAKIDAELSTVESDEVHTAAGEAERTVDNPDTGADADRRDEAARRRLDQPSRQKRSADVPTSRGTNGTPIEQPVGELQRASVEATLANLDAQVGQSGGAVVDAPVDNSPIRSESANGEVPA